MSICVVIPLAAGEREWRGVLSSLAAAERVILASAQACPSDVPLPANCVWLQCAAAGRAQQMNAAAASEVAAAHEFLWFVHADTRLPAGAVLLLQAAVESQPRAMHYFGLRFYDGGWKMRINEFGVRLRCALFQNPFGDQAFCISRSNYETLGGFCETAAYGEDHLFVLDARRHGIALHRMNCAVETSARRYVQQGWWRTLFLFQRLWIKQWWQHKPN